MILLEESLLWTARKMNKWVLDQIKPEVSHAGKGGRQKEKTKYKIDCLPNGSQPPGIPHIIVLYFPVFCTHAYTLILSHWQKELQVHMCSYFRLLLLALTLPLTRRGSLRTCMWPLTWKRFPAAMRQGAGTSTLGPVPMPCTVPHSSYCLMNIWSRMPFLFMCVILHPGQWGF